MNLGRKNRQEIELIAKKNGGDLLSVADLSRLGGIWTYPRNLVKRYKYGI